MKLQTEYRYSALYLNVAKFTRQRPDKCCNIQHLSGLFLSLFCQSSVFRLYNWKHISVQSVHNQIRDSPNRSVSSPSKTPPFLNRTYLQLVCCNYNTLTLKNQECALFFYRSIILMDSIPTLPPLTTSILLNSSFISFTTASFFVPVCTNSRSRLSLSQSITFPLNVSAI